MDGWSIEHAYFYMLISAHGHYSHTFKYPYVENLYADTQPALTMHIHVLVISTVSFTFWCLLYDINRNDDQDLVHLHFHI